MPTDVAADALAGTTLTGPEIEGILDAYENSQLVALRIGLFVVAVFVVAALFLTRRVPDRSFEDIADEVGTG